MEGCTVMSFLKSAGLGDILGTISPGLGMITGKGLGAEMAPLISPLGAMLFGHHGGGDGGDSTPVQAPAPVANSAATGLGHLIDVDPARIASIAGDIGKAANPIAAAGGATPAYQAAPSAPVQNHLQLLDPAVIRAILQQMGGGTSGVHRSSY
jgi:hypothetical protein